MQPHRIVLIVLATPQVLTATIDPDGTGDKYGYGANIGWINLAVDGTGGVVIGEYACGGSAWSANCGWISFGSGTPADGIRYRNDSASDFGVNVTNYERTSPADYTADLCGYAWGANIGWIRSEDAGDPRIDLLAGRLRGYAWSANCGWINLGEAGIIVATSISGGADSDADGIADAYEYTHAGPGDHNYDITFTVKPSRVYRVLANPDLLTNGWTATGGLISPAGPEHTATVADPDADRHHFWQVEAMLPLQP